MSDEALIEAGARSMHRQDNVCSWEDDDPDMRAYYRDQMKTALAAIQASGTHVVVRISGRAPK